MYYIFGLYNLDSKIFLITGYVWKVELVWKVFFSILTLVISQTVRHYISLIAMHKSLLYSNVST